MAKVFGGTQKGISIEISPKYQLSDINFTIINNTGELSTLSNYQTSKLKLNSVFEAFKKYGKYSIIILDEMLSGTGPIAGEDLIKKNVYLKQLLENNQLSLLLIEHNEETRERICKKHIILNYRIKDDKSEFTCGEVLCKKAELLEQDNPELFNAFLEGKFFGLHDQDKSNQIEYFEINKKTMKLRKITELEYKSIIKRIPDGAFSYSYTVRLNSMQNPRDRFGNCTFIQDSEGNKKIVFNSPVHKFTIDNKEYYVTLNILNVSYRGKEIVFNFAPECKFSEVSSLSKNNSRIILETKSPDDSYDCLPTYTVLAKDPTYLILEEAIVGPDHAAAIERYLNEQRKKAEEEKYGNLD